MVSGGTVGHGKSGRTKAVSPLRSASVLQRSESARDFVHDPNHVRTLVQHVEMDSGSAFFQEFGGLCDAAFDADVLRFGGIVADGFEFALKFPRQAGTAHGGNA